ncbi:MAG: thiamine diphosphokinase [Chloroflexi bacterium]|nr:thiamine diphosphokinase [Chloroflexota bacterium]
MPEPSPAPDALHAVVVANGAFHHPERHMAVVRAADLVIAADGGANWLHARGLGAHLLVGDLDSITPEAQAALVAGGCRVLEHPRRKDETDTELALLEAVARGARRITLIGASGNRIDHTLGNILLLAMPALEGIQTTIYDGHSYLSLVRREATVRGRAGDVVSLLPIGGDAEGVTTDGLEYPLRGETLRMGPARGISNVLAGREGRVAVAQGCLLMVHVPREHLEEAT